jgi:hypothetical protein
MNASSRSEGAGEAAAAKEAAVVIDEGYSIII